MSNVVIIDYGMGNLLSVCRAFEHLGAKVVLTDSGKTVENADRVVLPGVGAFADGMKGLRDRGLVDSIKKYALNNRPFLGICLGMQMMFEISEEFGNHKGLCLIKGRVVAILKTGAEGRPHKIPHIGWNSLLIPYIRKSWNDTIFADVAPEESVYFVHSFVVVPKNEENNLAYCEYNGIKLCAAIKSGNMYGCQFHPEKSGDVGLRIIKKFLTLAV